MDNEFPTRLRRLRERRRLSMYALSERCGMSRDMISRYERGKAIPNVYVLQHLADVFDTSTDYLLGRTDYPGKYPEKIL